MSTTPPAGPHPDSPAGLPVNPPADYPRLRVVLQRMLPDLAAGQRRIAQLVLDDPEGMAFRSIGESAKLAGVHQSSLVRFAAMLGFPGYPGLVKLCRAQLASEAQLVRRLEHAQERTGDEQFFGAIIEHDMRNVTRSFARVNLADWERAVELLASAPVVHVVGLRKCFSVAYLASYLLHMVRPRVRQLAMIGGLLADELRETGPDDVVLAVAIRRYTRDTVRALEYAGRRGAATIALTDDPSSPLARAADVTFYVETGSVTVLRSLTAFTSMVQALATAVAVRLGTQGRAELAIDAELSREFGLYDETTE